MKSAVSAVAPLEHSPQVLLPALVFVAYVKLVICTELALQPVCVPVQGAVPLTKRVSLARAMPRGQRVQLTAAACSAKFASQPVATLPVALALNSNV